MLLIGFAENMALMTVSYLIVRLLQTFDQIELGPSPESMDPRRKSEEWPSEETRYDMADGDTTYNIGITMAPRDGVWVRLRTAWEGAVQTGPV